MAPGSELPKVRTKGVVVARSAAAARLINDKATFYPVRFRNIDKLCKRLIRISHPSVLPTAAAAVGVAVACSASVFRLFFFFLLSRYCRSKPFRRVLRNIIFCVQCVYSYK